MRTVIIGLLLLSCATCSAASLIPPGQAYVSPIGGFSCSTQQNPDGTRVDEALGPHGGTVRIFDAADMTRVDFEQFAPPLNIRALAVEELDALYDNYLYEQIFPLVQKGVRSAKIVGRRLGKIGGRHVYLSAMLLPEKSELILANGKYADAIRAQIQYTDGRIMYTVSRMIAPPANMNAEAQLKNAYADVTRAFESCKFPN